MLRFKASKLAILAAAGLAISAALSGAYGAANLSIDIEGGIDCGQWLQARQAQQSNVYEGYVIGMLNGMSMGSGVSIWPGQPNQRVQMFFWLDEYCRTSPLKNTLQALVDFANEVTNGGYSRAFLRSSRGTE